MDPRKLARCVLIGRNLNLDFQGRSRGRPFGSLGSLISSGVPRYLRRYLDDAIYLLGLFALFVLPPFLITSTYTKAEITGDQTETKI